MTWADDSNAPLLADLHQLTMLQAYFKEGERARRRKTPRFIDREIRVPLLESCCSGARLQFRARLQRAAAVGTDEPQGCRALVAEGALERAGMTVAG